MQVYITKDKRIVKVCGSYPEEVINAYQVLSTFHMIEPGSVWGLDGVAEYIAKEHGNFALYKSGISKRQAQRWIRNGTATEID